MDPTATDRPPRAGSDLPLVPHVAVALVLGAVFVVSMLLAAVLPALAAVYLVVGFDIRDMVVVLVLWAASATVTVATFIVITQTYARTVLRRRVVTRLLPGPPAED